MLLVMEWDSLPVLVSPLIRYKLALTTEMPGKFSIWLTKKWMFTILQVTEKLLLLLQKERMMKKKMLSKNVKSDKKLVLNSKNSFSMLGNWFIQRDSESWKLIEKLDLLLSKMLPLFKPQSYNKVDNT